MTRYGATPEEWNHLDLILGLTEDLLPVVSNPHAVISLKSTLKQLGKVPSMYNGTGTVHGIVGWTMLRSSASNIVAWMAVADYGACVQTRTVCAIDIDLDQVAGAMGIAAGVKKHLGVLPIRCRSNSGKMLMVFRLPPGSEPVFKRRVIIGDGEVVELLGQGNQFVACGTHPSGVRYEWVGGLPNAIPEVSREAMEAMWAEIEGLAIEPPTRSGGHPRARGERLAIADLVADWLETFWECHGWTKDGLIITCPWADQHSNDTTGSSATVWLMAGTQGYERGHFKCLHAHCEGKTDTEFFEAIGYTNEAVGKDFPMLGEEPKQEKAKVDPDRYQLMTIGEVTMLAAPDWLVKDVIPKGDLAMMFGESGTGKSFVALDLACSVARGVPWRDCPTQKARVLYIAAEGGRGMRKRAAAYAQHHGLGRIDDEMDMDFIVACPNLLVKADVEKLHRTIRGRKYGLVVLDTLAQMTAGANENSGEDMGLAIRNCVVLSEMTGATIMMIHHAGKDLTKGARGWSGLKAANDTEIEIRKGLIKVTKQKDGDDRGRWGFALQTVIMGNDVDGYPITSCVVAAAVLTEDHADRPKGKWEGMVWDTLGEVALGGDAVVKAALIDDCLGRLAGEENDLRDARRKLQRAVTNLVTREKLQIEDRNGVEFVSFVEV